MANADETKKRRFLSLGLSPAGLLSAAGVVACVSSVLGFGESRAWWLDLFVHWRTQYFFALVVLAAVLLALKRRITAAVFAAFAFLNVAVVAPVFFADAPEAAAGAPAFRLAVINVNTANTRYDLLKAAVEESAPDFIILEEIDSIWLENLSDMAAAYPHFRYVPRDYDNMGIAFYSKRPFAKSTTVEFAKSNIPVIVAAFDLDARPLTVVALHAVPPANRGYWNIRNRQLREAARFAWGLEGPAIIAGDFNTTTWSNTMRDFKNGSRFFDSAAGRGPAFTWPAPYLPLLIPLDQCLHSKELAVLGRRVGPNIGSDHYPLLVDFAFAE